MQDNISSDFYSCLERIGNHFNQHLFEGGLPPTLFTLSGDMKMLGHFRYANWTVGQEDEVSEIILNPDLFAYRSWIQLFKTIVHQQSHLYQCKKGDASRPTYHNKEWARLMKDRGLMPSSTGLPGGLEIGQKMGEYIDYEGSFLRHSVDLIKQDNIFPITNKNSENKEKVISEELPLDIEESIREKLLSPVGNSYEVEPKSLNEKPSGKTKYVCNGCVSTVWGKPELNINCVTCNRIYQEIKAKS
jgi:predicted SprT family Zn-dependent metalloprotease